MNREVEQQKQQYSSVKLSSKATSQDVSQGTPISNITNEQIFTVETVNITPKNVVLLNMPIVAESVDMTINMLSVLKAQTLYLVISSPGGSVVDGARLNEYIRHSGKNIVTVCDNFCASMAFQIFQTGSKRLMTEKAILMAHPASGGTAGTIDNMYELVKMFKLYVDRMDADTASRAGIDYNKFKMMVANNVWVETPEAINYRLADGVVHLHFNSDAFVAAVGGAMDSKERPVDVLSNLKIQKLFNPEMLNVKGYVFKLQ